MPLCPGRFTPGCYGLGRIYYSSGKIHETLRVTPPMEAGVSDHVWSIEEIVNLLNTL